MYFVSVVGLMELNGTEPQDCAVMGVEVCKLYSSVLYIIRSFIYLATRTPFSYLTYLAYDDPVHLIFLPKAETELFQLQISATGYEPH